MPQAIPLIVQAVAAYLAVNAVVVAIAVLVASALVSNYQRRKQRRAAIDAYNASLEDRLVMTATANASRARVYGRARNSDGVVFKGTYGSNSERYVLVVSLAGHQIDGIEKLYFNDQPIDLVSDGVSVSGGAVGGTGYYVTTAPFAKQITEGGSTSVTITGGVGSVIVPQTPITANAVAGNTSDGYVDYPGVITGNTISFSGMPDGVYPVVYDYQGSIRNVRLWMYTGAPGQTLFPVLGSRFPSLVNANDKFSGMALVVVELYYDQDAFPTGVPNVSAVIRGARVFDPRNGVTAWSENPALIARDWALYKYGGDCSTDDINEPSFIAAANACDVVTTFNFAGGATDTRPLYQCGIVCPTDLSPDDLFGEIVESMGGKWGFSGGQIKVVAGVYRAPVVAIDDTFVVDTESVVVVKDPPKADLVNVYKPVISNANGWINGASMEAVPTSYTVTPMPAVRSQAFIDADGTELVRETTMLGVTRSSQAQHICNVLMRDARDGLLVQLTCNLRAWQIELFDVVTLTLPVFGFNAKQFEVLGWNYEVEKGVTLTLKETAASIYAVNSGLNVLDASPNTAIPLPWFVERITGVTVTSGTVALEDGWPQTRVEVRWNTYTDASVVNSGTIEVQYILLDTFVGLGTREDWDSVFVQGNSQAAVLTGLMAGMPYLFRARGINSLNVRGEWSQHELHVVAEPPLVDTGIIDAGAISEKVSFSSAQYGYSNLT